MWRSCCLTQNLHSEGFGLTNMQILRNIQRQNNATIFEEKEMGDVGEKKQDWKVP